MLARARWSRQGCVTLTSLAVLLSACTEPPTDVGVRSEAIYYGEPERGYLGVVYLEILLGPGMGAACSGTLVAPRVVVTAKHCTVDEVGGNVQPNAITVKTGPNQTPGHGLASYTVADIRRATGRRNGSDFAVLITDDPVDAETYAYATSWDLSDGDPITLMGYGQRDDDPYGGVKYRGDNQLERVFNSYFVTTGESACHGDSGGPAFDENDVLVGVIVNTIPGYGDSEDSCASGISGMTRVDSYKSIIDEAIFDAWVCDGEDRETCGDGRDNDCDHVIDNGCLEIGVACDEAVYCATGDCRDVGEGLRCVQSCSVGDDASCPNGFYCDEVTCGDALCALGEAGSRAIGEACEDDTECRTLTCAGGRCLRACESDADCVAGETCAGGGEGGCGGCTPTGPAAPFGAPCAAGADCASEVCVQDVFGSVCSTACVDACPEGFACGADGQCARPAPGGLGLGAPCGGPDDCASTLCGDFSGGAACTDLCDPGHPCPAGFSCEAEGDRTLCAPEGAIEGRGCSANEDCVSDLCGNFDDFRACTSACGQDAPCPGGFVCQTDGAAEGYCRPLEPPAVADDDSGCGCRAAGAHGPRSAAWFMLIAALSLVAKRARRGRAPRNRKDI